MANDSKNSKKIATKAAKVAGVAKVPKYAQREADSAPTPLKPSTKSNK
ncbi:hypothetical protein [Spirosoma foliorum]|uniref:Uncharacterized protein n=1 Tax=Spirosoma foliorum TaxID=2710596 RepID=A0A7G5H360_9BACT|nr:hypothetical protein [Spirosoma foliorum]QMW05552.1 hypothetical protein H3H32_12005 [Spirosoma foliorum]